MIKGMAEEQKQPVAEPAEKPAEAKPKKTLADRLREQGWKIVNETGGCVITGVQPPSPDAKKPE